ncbi:heavy-metal-associated domain-containing protein [Clostridium fallax]|uniref:Copper chaperone CopZ n=1 Tax=Clostridium fallax TaxID=1533 RepID=A0A1M4TLZ9_9CLOT|nr:heavy-metal-associated domain-containing protein [Clostridium fallax]SHE45519.1 Copper chaperone CopZ [Clostridium fallax]SQB22498.1 copper chaperone [Clostridium fallax]
MKSLIKIPDMKTSEDVKKIKRAITNNEGIIACEISKDKGEVSIVFDDYFTNIDRIIEDIEELGYTII